MAQALIDWLFSGNQVANQDGSMVATVRGATEVSGPGATALGSRSTALRFGAGASCRAQVLPANVDARRFAVRVLFRVTSPVTTRGNLVDCTALPFVVYVEPGATAERFNVAAGIANGTVGWSGANTYNRKPLLLNQWYIASLVYDVDTLALMIDEEVIAISAFPRGGLHAPSGDQLYVGTWVDSVRWAFGGEIAGLQIWRDIPEELETKLDGERGAAEWHLSRKENEVRPTLNLGPKTRDFYFDPGTGSYIQPYALAVLSYTDAHGAAFMMQGAILGKWRLNEKLRRELGPLVSDEKDGRRAGSRKNVFERGGIYWSPQSGANAVLGRMNLDFQIIGEGTSPIGLPIAEAEDIPGGKVQRFQTGKMYLRNEASNAFEAHGAILAKYEAAGGPARFGFPLTHESDVRQDGASIGKVSEFERCTIYWSPGTPASILYGAIRDRYRGTPSIPGEGGPLGDLGFPTSDEGDIAGAPGARFNTFQDGSMLWFGGPIFVCRPFEVALGRLDTREEDRDPFDPDGQNDLYCRVCIDVNGGRVFDRRYPEGSGHYPSANIFDLNQTVPYTIIPNNPSTNVRVRVEVWEHDGGQWFAGGDDHLGTMTHELNMTNAWGMRDGTNGLFRSSNFGPWVNFLDWSVRPRATASIQFDFWGVANRGTPAIDWREYGAAFGDVDPDFEVDFGIIDDGLKALFYEWVVKGVAAGGNCFGMCLEAIYAWKEQSRLGRPLARFTNWQPVENDFNVKHTYQVGADAIWWIIGQFLSGNTHNPVGVFQATWDAFNRGENPVVCISENSDFSGAPHCLLPISWDKSVSPWQMGVFDPNFPNEQRALTVDPNTNTFRYDGGSSYSGGAGGGGRFHYMPWSVLNHRQRTPVWDAIMLLVGGVVLIFADTAEVSSIADENNNSLEGAHATNRNALSGKLLRIPGLSGVGPVKGAFYAGKQDRRPILFKQNVLDAVANLHLAGLATPVFRPGVLRNTLPSAPAVRLPARNDAPGSAIAGAALMQLMRQHGASFLRAATPTDLDTIRTTLKGKANGKLDGYLKRGLRGVHISGDVAVGETVKLGFDRMSSRENEISIQSSRPRSYNVTVADKLGAGKDFLRVKLTGLSCEAGKITKLNVQPGVGVFDLLTPGASANSQMIVDGRVGGKQVGSTFNVKLQGGMRLVLPQLADPSRLKGWRNRRAARRGARLPCNQSAVREIG